jgi:hypothetical protein
MRTSIKVKRTIKKKIETSLGIKKAPPDRKNFSRKTIAAIRRFQHGYCAVNGCNIKLLLQADHIRGRDDNTAMNCQLLCPYHHSQKTNRDRIRKKITKQLEKE